MKLETIATVRSGLVLSRKLSKTPTAYRYPLLNLRCVNPKGEIDQSQLDVFHATEPLAPEYLSHVGDVVVRMSIPYTAVLIDEDTAGMVISSNFIIIRVHRQLCPGYLHWLLNTPQIKRNFYENTGGNMLGAVKSRHVSELELELPSLENQEKLAAMYQLSLREARLLHQLAGEKALYHALLLERAHHEMKRGNVK